MPETRPLAGVRILLGREHARDLFASSLEAAGAAVTRCTLTVTVPGEAAALAAARAGLLSGRFDWLVVTSARTLRFLDVTGLPGSVRTAAVGPATATALQRATGRTPDVTGTADAEALLALLTPPQSGRQSDPAGTYVRPGERVLLPASAIARPVLAEGLAALGAEVTRLDAYSTVPAAPDTVPPEIRRDWAEGRYDVVILTAASSVRAAAGLLGQLPGGCGVVVLGEPSAAAVRETGLLADLSRLAIARSPDVAGVTAAVRDLHAP